MIAALLDVNQAEPGRGEIWQARFDPIVGHE